MKTEQDNKNMQAYVAYKISKMQYYKKGHFWLFIFCCIDITFIGGVFIYAAFGSMWLSIGVAILNTILTIPPFVVKGKTNKLLFSGVSFSLTFCTVMFTLGAYCVITVGNVYLFVYWFIVLTAHILVSLIVTRKRIKSGYYQNAPVQEKVMSGVGYGISGVLGATVGRVVFASASQYIVHLVLSLIIIWANSLLFVIAIQFLQIYYLRKKLGNMEKE